jgi:hypothetical protein
VGGDDQEILPVEGELGPGEFPVDDRVAGIDPDGE